MEFRGDIQYLLNEIEILAKQYPLYSKIIKGYIIDTKLKYFKDGNFDYSKFPEDIKSN